MHCRPFNRWARSPVSMRRQGGAALVVALLVFGLCAAVIVAMKLEFTRFYQRSVNVFLGEQSQAYLRGA